MGKPVTANGRSFISRRAKLSPGQRLAEGYNERIDLTDFIKDIISRAYIEDIISRHPSVRDATVVGFPNVKYGIRHIALVDLMDNEEKTSEYMLKQFLIEHGKSNKLQKLGYTDESIISDAIARTSVVIFHKKGSKTQCR